MRLIRAIDPRTEPEEKFRKSSGAHGGEGQF
jgi:hypothetical protein